MKRLVLMLLIYFLFLVSASPAGWDREYIGINYKGFPLSTAEIDRDLALLGPNFGYIRTYISIFDPQKAIPSRVDNYNQIHPSTPVKVAMGVALTPNNPTASQAELDAVIALAKTYPGVVNAVVVGNENLGTDPKSSFNEQQLINYINYTKTQLSGTGVAVTTCQQWGVLYGNPDLVNACSSYALANIYPYFDGPGYPGGNADKAGADTLKNWQARFLDAYNQLAQKYPGKVRIGETGWPSGGSQVLIDGHYTGIPSQTDALPNEQTYVEQYANWASGEKLFSYIFAAVDEAWKAEPGNVGPHFGLYTATDVAKWILGELPAVSAGTILWLGNNSPYGALVFSGGTLLIIDPGTVWANSFDITPGTTSTIDNSGNSFIHTGTLSGGGNLRLTGTGITTNQGDGSGFSGTYTVAAGTLNLLNFLGSVGAPCAVVVNSGASLMGTGPVIGSVTNKGTVNPGNSPGTLSVVGSYAQTATGIFTVEIASATSYDKIQITGSHGTATLGGTLNPILLGGSQLSRNVVLPDILTATGGVSGSFNTINQVYPILTWQARYNANSVDLIGTANFASSQLPLTSNQRNVGSMLNGLSYVTGGDLNTVLNTIAWLPTGAAVADAYQQISPDKASALPALSLAGSMMQWQTVNNRLSYQRWLGGGLSSLAQGRSGSLNLSYNSLAGLMLAYNGSDLTGMTGKTKNPAAGAGTWGLFTDFVSSFGTQDSTARITGYDYSIFGFTAGGDYRLRDDLLIGLGTGYYNTSAIYKGSGGSAGVNSIPLYAYAAYTPGSFYAQAYLGYTLNLYSLHRNIAFVTLSRTATSSVDGSQLNASLETGYDVKTKPLTITPAFTLYYSQAWVGGFTENGAGSLNLNVSCQSADSLQTGLGLRLSRPFQSGIVILLPQFYAFWQHEFANNSRDLDARLAQAGNTFLFQTDSPSRDFALLGGGLAVGLKKNLTVQATYNAEIGRSGSIPQVVSAGLRLEF